MPFWQELEPSWAVLPFSPVCDAPFFIRYFDDSPRIPKMILRYFSDYGRSASKITKVTPFCWRKQLKWRLSWRQGWMRDDSWKIWLTLADCQGNVLMYGRAWHYHLEYLATIFFESFAHPTLCYGMAWVITGLQCYKWLQYVTVTVTTACPNQLQMWNARGSVSTCSRPRGKAKRRWWSRWDALGRPGRPWGLESLGQAVADAAGSGSGSQKSGLCCA